jgi:hypothetical protein
VFAYIIVQIVVAAFIIAALVVPKWYKYCWWTFGLVAADSNYSSLFDDEDTIDDVDDDACNRNQHMVENSCSDFCSSVKKFRAGGIINIIFSSLALSNIAILIFIHSLYLIKPSFRFKHVIWVSVMQPILYLGGLFSLLFYGQLYDLGSTHNRAGYKDPSDLTIESGLILSFVAAALNIIPLVYSLLITWRILRSNVV